MSGLSFDALVTPIDPKRVSRSKSLSARIAFLDVVSGEFRGKVTASKPDQAPYDVRIQAKEKTMRCECVDFERNLVACKHLIAFSQVCKAAVHGMNLNG